MFTEETVTAIEDLLAIQLDDAGIAYEREVQAVPGRKLRWDFRIGGLLVEIQGGTWSRKRTGHSTGTGIHRDCEKVNTATLHHWRVLLFTTDMVEDGTALDTIRKAVYPDN